MAQLSGSGCAVCGGRISGVLTGEFCPSCGCGVHKACKSPGPAGCEECGASDAAARLRARQTYADDVRLENAAGRQLLRRGLMFLVPVAFVFVATAVLTRGAVVAVCWLPLLAGLLFVGLALGRFAYRPPSGGPRPPVA